MACACSYSAQEGFFFSFSTAFQTILWPTLLLSKLSVSHFSFLSSFLSALVSLQGEM